MVSAQSCHPLKILRSSSGDVIVVAAIRSVLAEAIAEHGDLFHPDLRDGKRFEEEEEDAPWCQKDQVLAEVMIAPASRLVGQTLRLAGLSLQDGLYCSWHPTSRPHDTCTHHRNQT